MRDPEQEYQSIQIGPNTYDIPVCGSVCQWPRPGVTLRELLRAEYERNIAVRCARRE